jgi:hypothetical protein
MAESSFLTLHHYHFHMVGHRTLLPGQILTRPSSQVEFGCGIFNILGSSGALVDIQKYFKTVDHLLGLPGEVQS